MPQSTVLKKIYSKKHLNSWAHEKTMQHASGIWGRTKLFSYLKNKIKTGDCVVDLGCGTGYPTFKLKSFVGLKGKIMGYDNSCESIEIAKNTYSEDNNLSFVIHDVSQPFPLWAKSVDHFISFMLLHNLRGSEIDRLFKQIKYCMKDKGTATFLTMHPDAFSEDWDLDFVKYSKSHIQRWRKRKQDDVLIPGFVINACDKDKKPVMAYIHSHNQITTLLKKYSLRIADEVPIYIDRRTAAKNFGVNSIKQLPKVPLFWIFSIRS